MKKCKEKVSSWTSPSKSAATMKSNQPRGQRRTITKCSPSSIIISGRGRVLSAVLLLCLSVITTHQLVDFGVVAAQLAQPIHQISPSLSLNAGGSSPGLTPRHGGNLYAPQHGYDNNIEFIHEQTESIYEVPSQLDSHNINDHPNHGGASDNYQPQAGTEHEDVGGGLNDIPSEIGGAGDTYLNNGAPDLGADSDLHHRHHLDDESLNENQLPDDEEEPHSEFTELDGGFIVGEKILRQSESPYVLNTDLEVEKGGTLTVEPGVTLEFAPMVGITVRGVINAVGTATRKITFKSQLNSMYSDGEVFDPEKIGARLVEGPSPIQGRLQLFANGRWRSVCSNSRNWTIADYETVCRQMGFKGGRFWNWVERLENLQPRLLLEEPNCRGTENTLVNCDWHTRQIGSGVCDYHNDIGVQCLPLLEGTTSHWRGIRFENVDTSRVLTMNNRVYEAESLSKLEYVDIIRAGSGRHRSVASAIDVIGSPPQLSHVTVDFSAYTGINVTRPMAAFRFQDVTVRRSRGYGIFVNSSYGSAHMVRTTVLESGSDGVKYVGHDLRSDERTDKGNVHDFCTFPTAFGQTYPVALYVTTSRFHPTTKVCGKDFYTNPDYVLTMHFVHFVTVQNDTGKIEVFDGNSPNDRLLGSFSIRNFTRPQTLMTTKHKMYIRFTADPRQDIVGYFRLTTGPTKTYDLNVTESYIADNNGRGISVDNLRSSVHVHNSSVSNNGHIAGIHVLSGAGDVNITSSQISFNQGGGVNITYFGGNRNISRSAIVSNEGQGMAVWLNQTTIDRAEFVAFNQTTVVEYSNVFHNLETGVLHGNFCGDSWVNITGNHFNDSRSHGIDIQSCWFGKQEGRHTRLQIGQNHFAYSRGVGILINPALHLRGKIEYNTFRKGTYGAILIRNRPLVEFRPLPTRIIVQHNEFNSNRGLYVVSLGVSLYSDRSVQSLLFTRNFVRNNKIQEVFGTIQDEGFEGESGEGRLNPRSRVAAPLVISSSNVDIYRNIFSNPDSKYEIGSQLSDQSEVINATFNFLGNTDEEKIFEKLFHRYNRYDLAKIEYFPYLLHTSNPGTLKISAQSQFVPLFNHEGSHRIGGEIDGQIVLNAGSYTVEKDINIRPGGRLVIQPGVTLNFVPNVGMMVAGRLEARGHHPDDIMFTLKRAPIETKDNGTDINEMMDMEQDTEPAVINENLHPKVPIRLLGGENDHEGRLQVHLDGKWGTVCDYRWTIINAALVCHQLGLALNPHDWQLLYSEVPLAGTSEDVILSNVQCTEHDTDITKCRSEQLHKGEFYNSCSHQNDVGIRCYEGAWAGMRFGVLADRSDLQYVTIEKAGIFDYSTNTFKAALQMDFARHNLESVRIVNNLEDGLGVIYSDIFGGNVINNVKNSEFSGNRGNGITLKQLGLQVSGSIIEKNRGAGINHDYVLSAVEQRELASWFHVPNDLPDYNEEESNYRPIVLPRDTEPLHLDVHQIRHIITNPHVGEPIERRLVVTCQPGYVIGVQLLNPIENRSTEDVWFIDSQTGNPRNDVWQLKRDLTMFPATSSSYGIILNYKSGEHAIGGVVMTVSTVPAPVQNIRHRVVRGPVPTLLVHNTKIKNNHQGLTATYYNRYLGNDGEHYLRKANESIKLVNCEISNNHHEAFFIHSPFWDAHESNISEVTIHVNGSLVMNNGRGIRQFSKDLRSSNNLFHYVLQDTTVEQNTQGGLELNLPHVWQYNENFTHSVYIGNTTWVRNRNFGVLIAGHFAEVNMTGSSFYENQCLQGVFGFKGMEKKIQMDNNRFMNNNGRFIVEFKADSLSEILGEVHAVFEYNDIRNNRYEKPALTRGFSMAYSRGQLQKMSDPTCVIGFGGIQKVRVLRNLFTNNVVDYDLIAGVVSATLANILDARENWWGSTDTLHIDQRIFDFDDWNNHAEVLFKPYLLEDNVFGSISIQEQDIYPFDIENMGGRLYDNVTVLPRTIPYKITSDITVMPGATLSIRPGVELEFAANVGMLVLGTLEATGTPNNHIVMRPMEKTNNVDRSNRIERDLESLTMHDSIRLCVNRNCTIDDTREEPFHEGFLEYFNHTTVQWVPICDSRFTERNAQVVCRELGFDPLKVFYGHDRRLEYHTNSLTRIWSWVQPLECDGDETHTEDCPERLNGQLYGRRHECKWDSVFVFVSCQGVPNEKNYWGGIRFANPEFEQNIYVDRLSRLKNKKRDSTLSFVTLEQAGILHGEKSPAVQTVFKNPMISSVTIKDCAHHGVNLISPTEGILLNLLKVDNVLGQGISAISLTGEGRESDESSFTPLRGLDLPYNIFSMIDMCDPKKVITIEERVLVYYKYDNNPVNCVKIFNSAYRAKPLGFRLLQSHLFNHSLEYGRPDGIHIFDGDIYNFTSRIKTKKIDVLHANSPKEKNLFRTTMPSLSLRLVASGAPAHHGFIAEIVTLPISAIGFNRDAQHNVSNSEITRTFKGALSYHSAGEVSPILSLDHNRFMENGQQFYGNFSTCDAAIHLDVQNMHSMFFRNNLVQQNQGGLWIRADSRGSATSLRGFIHHNLFTDNRNRPALAVDGRQSSPYQEVTIFSNYITQNKAAYENVIRLKQVVSNFTYNYVHSNTGGQVMDISGFDKVRLPIYQSTSHNGFYSNVATDWRGRATIVAGTAGQHYIDNVFWNPDNDYEIITVNQSIYEYNVLFWNSSLELGKTKIDARQNFWHFNDSLAVRGRIRDFFDDPNLIEVDYRPFHMNNKTVLDGKCPPGWTQVIDTCYIYIGAPMTFSEARDFCRSDNATLPFIRLGDRHQLWQYLIRQMVHFRGIDAVWIQDINFIEQCTSFIYDDVRIDRCDYKRPFICEIDPQVQINPLSWSADIGTMAMIAALILTMLLLCVCCCCWWRKSKVRHSQRLQRRNSIRQSIRSLNSIGADSTLRRRNMNMSRSNDILSSAGTDYKKMESNGSFDSMEKATVESDTTSFENYDTYNSRKQPTSPTTTIATTHNDPLSSKFGGNKPHNSSYGKGNLAQIKTPKIYTRPGGVAGPASVSGPISDYQNGVELSFRNEGFRDNSTVYSGTTRQNSVSTVVTEGTPIIDHADDDGQGSDYYGDSSTLPMANRRDNLSFLVELKNKLPEYETLPRPNPNHSSFMPSPESAPRSMISDEQHRSSMDSAGYHRPQIRKPMVITYTPEDPLVPSKRPDSYYTAMKTARDSSVPPAVGMKPAPPPPMAASRPRTVYESSGDQQLTPPPLEPTNRSHYARSKSEAILETNFDDAPINAPLSIDNRSHSQPLETAM